MHVVLTQKKKFRKLRNISKKKISGFFLFVNKIQILTTTRSKLKDNMLDGTIHKLVTTKKKTNKQQHFSVKSIYFHEKTCIEELNILQQPTFYSTTTLLDVI